MGRQFGDNTEAEQLATMMLMKTIKQATKLSNRDLEAKLGITSDSPGRRISGYLKGEHGMHPDDRQRITQMALDNNWITPVSKDAVLGRDGTITYGPFRGTHPLAKCLMAGAPEKLTYVRKGIKAETEAFRKAREEAIKALRSLEALQLSFDGLYRTEEDGIGLPELIDVDRHELTLRIAPLLQFLEGLGMQPRFPYSLAAQNIPSCEP